MQVKEVMSTAVEVVGRNDDLSQVEDLMVAKKLRTPWARRNGSSMETWKCGRCTPQGGLSDVGEDKGIDRL